MSTDSAQDPLASYGQSVPPAVDGMVERMQKELGSAATAVATGGLAGVVVPACHSIDHHDPLLTLEGLRLIFEKNTSADE